jgi:hypothetical protein
MLFIVPSRSRPENVERLIAAWDVTGATATLCVAYDEDDPLREQYSALIRPQSFGLWGHCGPREKIGRILNRVADYHLLDFEYVGFMGDDHVPRTTGWDAEFAKELGVLGTGVVYGNDLLMGEKMPTAVCMTTDIVQTLGYMAPPPLEHLCLDLIWKDWGEGIGKLRYRDDVVIEHMHPANGKADLDASYAESNSPSQTFKDSEAYYAYRDGTAEGLPSLQGDLSKLRPLLVEV